MGLFLANFKRVVIHTCTCIHNSSKVIQSSLIYRKAMFSWECVSADSYLKNNPKSNFSLSYWFNILVTKLNLQSSLLHLSFHLLFSPPLPSIIPSTVILLPKVNKAHTDTVQNTYGHHIKKKLSEMRLYLISETVKWEPFTEKRTQKMILARKRYLQVPFSSI